MLAVLLAGNVWALADFVEFARTPFEPGRSGSVWTLPFVHSQLDYMIWPDRARWVTEMAARADAGETILLVYGLGAYNENFSNPDGVLEHLYVHLGHERFVQHVIVFSSDQCHYGCVPVRPMSELGAYLDALQAGGPERWANAVGYRVLPEEWDSETFRTEREQVLSALEARFVLLVDSPPTASVTRFRLEPRSASSP